MDRLQLGKLGFTLLMLAMWFYLGIQQQDLHAADRLRHTILRRNTELDRFRDWYYRHGTSAPGYNETLESVNSTNGDVRILPPWNHTFHLPDLQEPLVQPLVQQLHKQPDHPVYFRNLTGFIRGQWSGMGVALPNPISPINATIWANMTQSERLKHNATLPDAQQGRFNWSAPGLHSSLKVEWNLRETEVQKDIQDWWFARGSVELKRGDRSVSIDVDGVHHLANGSYFFVGAPNTRLTDIRHLPALMPDDASTNRTAQVILQEMNNRINKLKAVVNSNNMPVADDSSADEQGVNCTFQIYGQLAPVHHVSAADVAEYEAELRGPTGARIVRLAPPRLSAILHSPNCQLLLKTDEAEALSMDRFWQRTVNYAICLSIVSLAQTLVLLRQMRRGSTASALSKLSYWTFASQGGMDSYSFVTHLSLAAVVDSRASLSLFVPAFFASMSGLLFGMRYAANIRIETIDNAPARPTPVEPAPDAGWAENASRYVFGGMAFLICCSIFFYGYFPTLAVLLYSYWIPQIYKNAQRGSARRVLVGEYIVGTTLCRLFLPIYIWGYPDNVLFTETSGWVWLLVAYNVLQMVVLLLQGMLGARFFVPPRFKHLLPAVEHWDYFGQPTPADLENGKGDVDCVICLNPIRIGGSEKPNDAATGEQDGLLSSGSVSSMGMSMGRWTYMIPPCHHIMHTQCLEQWLAIKSECPTCRRPLPSA